MAGPEIATDKPTQWGKSEREVCVCATGWRKQTLTIVSILSNGRALHLNREGISHRLRGAPRAALTLTSWWKTSGHRCEKVSFKATLTAPLPNGNRDGAKEQRRPHLRKCLDLCYFKKNFLTACVVNKS